MKYYLLALALILFLVGCTGNPETVAKREAAKAEELAAEEAERRFEVVSQQKVEGRRIWVLKDKETGHEYVFATYGESLVFRPLLKKKER